MLAAHHNSFATIVVQALGGKKTTPTGRDPNAVDVTAGAQTEEDAVLAINRMLTFS